MQQLAAMHGISLYDLDDIETMIDIVGEFGEDEPREDALEVLYDYVSFQLQESMFAAD